MRLVKVRSRSASGTCAIGPCHGRPERSRRDWTKDSPAVAAATVNAPAQTMAAETWMTSQ